MRFTIAILSLAVVFNSGPAFSQTRFAEALQFPQRLIFTPVGNLLVSEGGTATPNTGRVSILNRQGSRRSLLEGLPAGSGHGIPAFGPAGMALDGRTLYLVLGEGDVQAGPPFVINLNGPSSPIFHSILRIQFSNEVDNITTPFQLNPVDHWALSDGYDLGMRNASGDNAIVHLLTAFRPLFRNILGGAAPHRPSDPYSLWLDSGSNTLYVVDAAAETLSRVNTVTGRSLVITRFQPDERATATGTQLVDTVPTAACPIGDSFLVSFLSAAPFPAGASSVRLWTPADGPWSRLTPLISDLTMTTDLLCLRGGTAGPPRVVTVEYSTTTDRTIPSGRVQLIDGSQRRAVMRDILLPTSVSRDPVSGDLFVATLPGVIFRAPLP
jgi:hypothetical protein